MTFGRSPLQEFIQHASDEGRAPQSGLWIRDSNFYHRAFWPGSPTSTCRSELGFGGAYARSRIWFSRPGHSTPAAVCGFRQRLRLRFRYTLVVFPTPHEPFIAEQGARANATIRHASCCRTSRAGWRRGTSLTFGKKPLRAWKKFC